MCCEHQLRRGPEQQLLRGSSKCQRTLSTTGDSTAKALTPEEKEKNNTVAFDTQAFFRFKGLASPMPVAWAYARLLT